MILMRLVGYNILALLLFELCMITLKRTDRKISFLTVSSERDYLYRT